jgi:hypothetical protein
LRLRAAFRVLLVLVRRFRGEGTFAPSFLA